MTTYAARPMSSVGANRMAAGCLLVPPGESVDVIRAGCDDGYVLHWTVRRGSLMNEGYASFYWTAHRRARRALRQLRKLASVP